MIPTFDVFLNEQLLSESINDENLFKAIFMAGGGGSGKSFIADMGFGRNEKMKTALSKHGIFVNSDIAFEYLLDKNKLPFDIDDKKKVIHAKQMDIRKTAKDISNVRFHHWVNGMLPLIIDGTARDYDKIKRQFKALTDIGYDCAMIFVNTSLDVTIERNANRKRKVRDEKIIVNGWKQVQQNMGKFQSLFGSNRMLIVDNNRYLEGGELKELELRITRYIMKLMNASLTNQIGRNTIDKIKQIKGKYISDIQPDIMTQQDFNL